MNEIQRVADKYMTAKYSSLHFGDFFHIDYNAPVESIQDDIKNYLDDGITVTPEDAKNIIHELKAGGYRWVTDTATGITFMAGLPNDFLTAVAMVIEL